MDEGFNDASIQNMRKAQLSKIEQTTKERVRDFKTRIDDLYKSAYGRDAAASQDAAVVRLRGSLKKEVFLRGIRLNIRKILWSKLEMDDTFEMIVAKAQNCEHAVDLQRETEESEPHKRLGKENNENNIRETEFQQIMKALANVQLSAQNVGAASGTVAQISTEEQQEPRRSVRFADRTRSYSPFPRDSYSRSRELIIPRDRSYSPGRQRYESSDREQYRRPQPADGLRDGSGDWDKNRSYGYRSYPLGSNERISNRGGTNSRSVSPGLNKSYRPTREEYSQAGVDRQESRGTSDYREREQNKTNYTTNQETGRPNQINDKDDRTCYFCRNKGHIKRACRKFQKYREGVVKRWNQQQETEGFPFLVARRIRYEQK
jgi:hypothetical protein